MVYIYNKDNPRIAINTKNCGCVELSAAKTSKQKLSSNTIIVSNFILSRKPTTASNEITWQSLKQKVFSSGNGYSDNTNCYWIIILRDILKGNETIFKSNLPITRDVYNTRTNTPGKQLCNIHAISNSSLQDIDKSEFTSTELIKYMKEMNEEFA